MGKSWPVEREHLHALAPIANQDAARAVDTNARWPRQLPWTVALLAERRDEAAVCREHTHAVVVGITNQPIVVDVGTYATRVAQLSVFFATFTELAQKLAVVIVHLEKIQT